MKAVSRGCLAVLLAVSLTACSGMGHDGSETGAADSWEAVKGGGPEGKAPWQLGAEAGFQHGFGDYIGEKAGDLYLGDMPFSWGPTAESAPSDGQNLSWRISKDLKMMGTLPAEACYDPAQFTTWESALNQPQEAAWRIVGDEVWVGDQRLYRIPGYSDGSDGNITRVNVQAFAGSEGEVLYDVGHSTLPVEACPPHDSSEHLLVVVKEGEVRQVPLGVVDPTSVLPMAGGGYLIPGFVPGLYEMTLMQLKGDGAPVDMRTAFCEEIHLPPDAPAYPQFLGLRGTSAVFFMPDQDILKTAFYELSPELTLKRCPETLAGTDGLSGYPRTFMGTEGTLYATDAWGERLYDLTHRRFLDLFRGEKSIGDYVPKGTITVVASHSGARVTLPQYQYKGDLLIRAEDLEGRGFTKDWDPKHQELRLETAEAGPTVETVPLKGGSISRSPVRVYFGGVPVICRDTGKGALVSVNELVSLGIFQYEQ